MEKLAASLIAAASVALLYRLLRRRAGPGLAAALALVAALAVPHLAVAARAWRDGLDYAVVRRLQRSYRALFALIGLVMAAAAVPW